MQDQLHGLTGPDFLDHVADAEAANGNDINAAVYRERSLAWQRDLDRLAAAEADADSARRALERARRELQAA